MKKAIYTLFAAFAHSAPRAFNDDEDATLLNRGTTDTEDRGIESATIVEKATSFKKVTMMARMLNSKDSQGKWHERGVISLGYANQGHLHSVEVAAEEQTSTDLESVFKAGCDKKQLY